MLRLMFLGVVLYFAVTSMNRQDSAGRLPEPDQLVSENLTESSPAPDSAEPEFPFVITPQALNYFQQVFEQYHSEHGSQDSCARFWVVPGGCRGYTFKLEMESEPEAGDLVYEQQGIRLAIPGQQQQALRGARFDYVITPTEKGLDITLSQQAFATTEPTEENSENQSGEER